MSKPVDQGSPEPYVPPQQKPITAPVSQKVDSKTRSEIQKLDFLYQMAGHSKIKETNGVRPGV